MALPISGVGYGTYYMGVSLILLVAVLFLDKHYIGLATVINLFFTGYVVDFASNYIAISLPYPTIFMRAIMLLVGIVVMCFASSLYMTSDLGVSVYDAIPIIISKRTGKQFRIMRICSDLICVIIGALCGLLPGLGTVKVYAVVGPDNGSFRTQSISNQLV